MHVMMVGNVVVVVMLRSSLSLSLLLLGNELGLLL